MLGRPHPGLRRLLGLEHIPLYFTLLTALISPDSGVLPHLLLQEAW